jgi:cell division protein FtsI (penicillin-binding protein 3)
MSEAIEKFTAKGGAGLIMDVNSGEILAAVSLPDFNPLDINAANDDQKFNRFALGVYEMGSTFKAFTTAILIDRIDPSLSQIFDASKPIVRGRFRINDFRGKKTTLTLPEVFMHSSNIGTALMAEKVGTPVLKDFFKNLGLMQPVPIDLPERAAPLLPNPWREISTITASYGHGMSVTPLHLIRAFASIVNGGTLPALHVVKDEKDEMRPRVISEKTSDEMRQLLRLVVTNGTAKSAIIPETLLAGKTGTSEKIVDGRYARKKLISSFIATFPADKPRYAVLISVDEPIGNKKSYGYATAGWVAVPAVAALTKSMVALDNIPPSGTFYDENLQTKMLEYMPLEKKEAEKKAAAANKTKKPVQ